MRDMDVVLCSLWQLADKLHHVAIMHLLPMASIWCEPITHSWHPVLGFSQQKQAIRSSEKTTTIQLISCPMTQRCRRNRRPFSRAMPPLNGALCARSFPRQGAVISSIAQYDMEEAIGLIIYVDGSHPWCLILSPSSQNRVGQSVNFTLYILSQFFPFNSLTVKSVLAGQKTIPP